MRTIDNIETELEDAKNQLESIEKTYNIATLRVRKLQSELREYRINNNMFTPISELKNHCEKELYYIDVVERMQDGTSREDSLCYDGLKIDSNGHLIYSDEQRGIMSYDENTGLYDEWYKYCNKKHDYVGYLDIGFRDE